MQADLNNYNNFIKAQGVGEKVLNMGTRAQSSKKKVEQKNNYDQRFSTQKNMHQTPGNYKNKYPDQKFKSDKNMKESRGDSPINKLKLQQSFPKPSVQPFQKEPEQTLAHEESIKILQIYHKSDEQVPSSMKQSMYLIKTNQQYTEQNRDSQTSFEKQHSQRVKNDSEDSLPNLLDRFGSKKIQSKIQSSFNNFPQYQSKQGSPVHLVRQYSTQNEDKKLSRQLCQIKEELKIMKKNQEKQNQKFDNIFQFIKDQFAHIIRKSTEMQNAQMKIKQFSPSKQNYSTLQKQCQTLSIRNAELAKKSQLLEQKLQQSEKKSKSVGQVPPPSFSEIQLVKEKQKLAQQLKILKEKLSLVEEKPANLNNNFKKQEISSSIMLPPEKPLFVSNILFKNSGESFIKFKIEQFQRKSIRETQLMFIKDRYNNNIGNYIEQYPYPFLLLIETHKNVIFGVFGQGIQSQFTCKLQQKNISFPKFNAFLFNLSKQLTFCNEKPTAIQSTVYSDSLLKVGNNEILFKNNSLDIVKVHASRIFGESYFNVRNRQSLTGEQTESIQIKNMELHKISF